MAKTERLSATNGLDGETLETATASVVEAMNNLAAEGIVKGRTMLWDTLELSVETSFNDTRTLMQFGAHTEQTHTEITVSALGVRS